MQPASPRQILEGIADEAGPTILFVFRRACPSPAAIAKHFYWLEGLEVRLTFFWSPEQKRRLTMQVAPWRLKLPVDA